MKLLMGVAAFLVAVTVGAYVVVEMNEIDDVVTVAEAMPTAPTPTETPSPSPTPSPVAVCSGTQMAGSHDHEMAAGLPVAVANVRMRIIEAAIACDYAALEEIALAEGEGFSYSFGVEESPSSFWRAREREARKLDLPQSEYMRYLVSILQLPYCKETNDDGSGTDTEVVYYVWPRVSCMARTDSDWDDLDGFYTQEQIEQMRTDDLYYGFRGGILENGDWVYFIAGD
jgi:hypothetical protein